LSNKFVKILTKVQQNILSFVKKSKYGVCNQEISASLNLSRQVISYNVKKLVDYDLVVKNHRIIRKKVVKKSHGPCAEEGIHRLLYQVPILKVPKDLFEDLKCKEYNINGVKNFFCRTEIDCSNFPTNLKKYGRFLVGFRFMLGNNEQSLMISFKDAKVPTKDFGEAEKDYENILYMYLMRFKNEHKGLLFDIVRLEQTGTPHYKIANLPEEFADFWYSDDTGLIIDSSPPEKKPHLEHENREKAQIISDLPDTIEKTQAEIASLNEIIKDVQIRIKELHAYAYLSNEEKKLEKKYEEMFR
jgi:predicted DNA-binding protein YlxM (UPF0122 family)